MTGTDKQAKDPMQRQTDDNPAPELQPVQARRKMTPTAPIATADTALTHPSWNGAHNPLALACAAAHMAVISRIHHHHQGRAEGTT